MTTIILNVPDELATRLQRIEAHLPRLLEIALELTELTNAPPPENFSYTSLEELPPRTERLAALNDIIAFGATLKKMQQKRGVQDDIDSVTLLNQLREMRDDELTNLP